MESIRDIFITGYGPSSSHTIAPAKAVEYLLNKYKDIEKADVTLFGSLALTGIGHGTDAIIKKVFAPIPCNVIADSKKKKKHINTMEFVLTTPKGIIKETIVSIGGGSILTEEDKDKKPVDIYPSHTLAQILRECIDSGVSLSDYVIAHEGEEILTYLKNVLHVMEDNIESGLHKEGYLPGPFKIKRRAKDIYEESMRRSSSPEYCVMASAFAVAEENASGSIVTTAPTCGSCGVIPGAITYLRLRGVEEKKIIEGLCVAGIIGKVIKTNATVSGAVGGCQAEIGSATAMAAAMISSCFDEPIKSVAQAAEIALEHSLGLTCDPVGGYVLIPCIERNAIYAVKAINCARLSAITNPAESKVHFDEIVETMYQTGLDMNQGYKETSTKGLSKLNIC
ncbi:MAG: L-serine ammonia-lyase, iron-sulfur-dependent, subunit alpha [Bacilli bacterium]|nr:L-serine ammonia-lyase, iron-sulfur-dependent, subunit alpha [Bacilli bacterium]